MSRTKENKRFVDWANKIIEKDLCGNVANKTTILALIDISKSCAVIADTLTEKKAEATDTKETQPKHGSKEPEIIRCGECKHKKDHHYENPGEEPYIKSTCKNKYGLVKNYQVHDWDFCSRAERRTDADD